MATAAPHALYGLYALIGPYLKTEKNGGIVGDTSHVAGGGYHISREDLIKHGQRGDYSIQCPADKRGPSNLAAGVDITFGSLSELETVHRRLKVACEGKDPRIEPLREHIGTLDGKHVSGYNRVATGSGTRSHVGWVPTGFSDSSHLWHEHLSFLRDRVEDVNAVRGVAEVMCGLAAGTLGWVGDGSNTPPVVPPVVPPKPPVKGITTPVKFVSLNAQWPEFESTKTKVAQGKVKPWSIRKGILAAKIGDAKIVAVQELGQSEAADLAAALGQKWSYQRLTLNCVFWHEDAFDYTKTRELVLNDYGQWPGRSYLEVWLKDKTGNPLRVASTHLTVKTNNDATDQLAQIKAIVAFANDSNLPLVVGIDTNNTQRAGTGIWVPLEKAHYTWDRGGLDAILWNYGVTIPRTDNLDLGDGSDHNGRTAMLTTGG